MPNQERIKEVLRTLETFTETPTSFDIDNNGLTRIRLTEDKKMNTNQTPEELDYQLNVLNAAAEAGDAETAKAWLNHCAELDAIVTEPNDNLRKAVQALSDAGMLFNSNTDEPFYLTEGADIQLPKKSITLTDEEMNELIGDSFNFNDQYESLEDELMNRELHNSDVLDEILREEARAWEMNILEASDNGATFEAPIPDCIHGVEGEYAEYSCAACFLNN